MVARQTVLIVEDEDDLRRIYRDALSLAGYRVRESRSGFEALRVIDNDPPDLVLLDLVLPGIDGFAVRHELAAQVHTRHIPILIVTGSHGDHEHLNVDCVMRKPVTPEELVTAVRSCLASVTRPPDPLATGE